MKRTNIKRLVSAALALPGALMLYDWWSGATWAMDLLHPSGEMAVRLMVLAMLPGPLVEGLGTKGFMGRFLRGWLMIRRNLGVGAFGYALLHLAFYAIDMTPSGMVDELPLPGIWTGWLALFLLLPPASISFDRAVRTLGARWKLVQRLVYLALAAGLAHWVLLAWSPLPALVHIAPLALAWALRGWKRRQIRVSPSSRSSL